MSESDKHPNGHEPMDDMVNEAEAVYVTPIDALPPESPEEMAALMGVEELESVTSSFKMSAWLANEAEDPARRERSKKKAEYWRKVAQILWERREKGS